MMRSLFAAVSGLRNHQTRMDVIGNNIANVNTVGFKSSRVTFAEAFAQLLQGASRPPGDLGGINPIQIGLGSKIGSIDMNFSQGNLESTGQTTDLAIQGDGFFVVSDGSRTFYTRAGNFQLDANGRMVSPANGFKVQGINADSAGQLSTGSSVTDITLPFGQKSPARATSELKLTGNLDSRDQPLGTILKTQGKVFAIEQTGSNAGVGSDMSGLYANGAANAQVLGMVPNGTTVAVTVGAVTQTYTYVPQDTGAGNKDFHSLLDLRNEMDNDFGARLREHHAQRCHRSHRLHRRRRGADAQHHQLQPRAAQVAGVGQRHHRRGYHQVHRPVQPRRHQDRPRGQPAQWRRRQPGSRRRRCRDAGGQQGRDRDRGDQPGRHGFGRVHELRPAPGGDRHQPRHHQHRRRGDRHRLGCPQRHR